MARKRKLVKLAISCQFVNQIRNLKRRSYQVRKLTRYELDAKAREDKKKT